MKKNVFFIVLLLGMTAWQLVNAQSVTITPATADICEGSGTNVSLTAVPDGGFPIGYSWNTGGNTSTITVSPSVTTTYTVTATLTTGTATATATVTVLPQPAQATITPVLPTTVCTGDSVRLDASAGNAWQWYLNGNPIIGANTQTHFAKTTGDYTVLVTVGTCNAPMSTATAATIITPPVANVTPSGLQSACYGNVVTLTADPVPGASYQWQYSPNGLAPWANEVGETNQTYDADRGGFFRVAVSLGGCTNYSE